MRRFLALFTAPLLLTFVAAPVLGVERDQFRERFTEQDQFWTETCGFPVLRDTLFSGHQMVFADGSVMFTINETTTYSANGNELLYRGSHTGHREPGIVVVDETAGTSTETVDVTFTGLGIALIERGGGLLAADRGSIEVRFTFVVDLDSGELLAQTIETFEVRGPHPGAAGEVNGEALICDALAA